MSARRSHPLGTFATAVIIFLVGYAIEIGVDVWVVNHPDPTDPFSHLPLPPVTHIRHYVLPLVAFASLVLIFLRRVVPAGHDGMWILEVRGPLTMAFGCFFRALVWMMVGIAVFQTAAWLQCRLYGFFLPP